MHLSELPLARENIFICFQKLAVSAVDFTIMVTSNGLERLSIRADSLPAQVIESVSLEHDQAEASSSLLGNSAAGRILQDVGFISRLSSDELLLATKWLSIDPQTAKTNKSVNLTVLKLKGEGDVSQVPSIHVYNEVVDFNCESSLQSYINLNEDILIDESLENCLVKEKSGKDGQLPTLTKVSTSFTQKKEIFGVQKVND